MFARGELGQVSILGSSLGNVGDEFNIRLSFDPNEIDLEPTDDFGFYSGSSFSLSLSLPQAQTSLFASDVSVSVTSALDSMGSGVVSEIFVSGVLDEFGPLVVFLRDDDNSLIIDDSLANSFGSLDEYSLAFFSVLAPFPATSNGRQPPNVLSGSFGSIAVPEPSVWAFMLLTGLGGLRRHRIG